MLKNLFVYIYTIGAFSCSISVSGFAFDLSILKNDKESESHAYRSAASPGDDPASTKAFQLLGESLNEIEKQGKLCDLSVLQKFIAKLTDAQIATDHQSIVDLLITWRSQNLIDDIFFEIIKQSSSFNESLRRLSIQKIRPSEIISAEEILQNQKIEDQELKSVYKDLESFNTKNIGCSADAWINISRSLSFAAKKQKNIRPFNVAARSKNIISEEAFELAEFFRLNDVQSWEITLRKYLSITTEVKNKSRVLPIKASDLKTNELSSTFKYKKSKTTYRQSLYYRFNSIQIGMISDVLKKTFERMDATKTEVVFNLASGKESIPVSPMGQYFLARKLLKKDMEELRLSTFFGGVAILHEDLITAALETGLITADMLDSALKIDDLWNPEVKQWIKIVNYGFRVTGTATIFLPAPYNIVSSIALTFIEGLVGKKTKQTNSTDNSYDFF